MSSNTSMYACPKCGNPNTHVERRPDGFCYCPDCQHRWKIGESQPKPTNGDVIRNDSNRELAEYFVYDTGAMWASTLIVDKTFDTYEEALEATEEYLNAPAESGEDVQHS